jgi:hypothetical protein
MVAGVVDGFLIIKLAVVPISNIISSLPRHVTAPVQLQLNASIMCVSLPLTEELCHCHYHAAG